MVAPASVWLIPEGSPSKIEEILVPIDFSDHSADALAVAANIARLLRAGTIRAVHVFFDPSTIRYDEHVEEIRGQEEAAFARFIKPIDRQGVEVEPVFIEGTRTAHDILNLADRSGTDLDRDEHPRPQPCRRCASGQRHFRSHAELQDSPSRREALRQSHDTPRSTG